MSENIENKVIENAPVENVLIENTISENLPVESTPVKSAPVKNAVKEKLVAIKVLLPLAGKFLLPNDPSQIIKLPELQANEIVEAKYAEFVNK